MIADFYHYDHAREENDHIIIEISVDEELINVMRGAIIIDMREAANYLSSNMDPDEYLDAINHIKDLVKSLNSLDKALNSITQVNNDE